VFAVLVCFALVHRLPRRATFDLILPASSCFLLAFLLLPQLDRYDSTCRDNATCQHDKQMTSIGWKNRTIDELQNKGMQLHPLASLAINTAAKQVGKFIAVSSPGWICFLPYGSVLKDSVLL
jgi:hypothetical protein